MLDTMLLTQQGGYAACSFLATFSWLHPELFLESRVVPFFVPFPLFLLLSAKHCSSFFDRATAIVQLNHLEITILWSDEVLAY